MKRSTPLARRTPLKRTSLRRDIERALREPLPRRPTRYRRRARDFEFMGWVKRQPCIVRVLPPRDFAYTLASRLLFARDIALVRTTPCDGPIEADHAGERGLGRKAADSTCIPLCRGHHRERTDHAGTFRPLTRDELRAWRARAIEHTQAAWRNR